MAKDAKPREETFEQIYARLEEQVAKLEQGGLPLDDAIALYEAGMELARACQERLDQAEQRITKLRESFALAGRSNGTVLRDETLDDYEYVADSESPAGELNDSD